MEVANVHCEELFRTLQARLEQARTERSQCQVQIIPPVLLGSDSGGLDEHEQIVQRYRRHQLEQHGFEAATKAGLGRSESDGYSRTRLAGSICATDDTSRINAASVTDSNWCKPTLNLFEERYLQERLRKPWARLEIELRVNRLLVYLESVPERERSRLKTWLLQELFAHRLGGDRVEYEEGAIRGLRGLVCDADGGYHWAPVTTTPAIMAERVREVITVQKGAVKDNDIIPLIPTQTPIQTRKKVALKPR